MILAQNLSYHLQHAGQTLNLLNDISFEIPTGQSVAIVGQSGSGKTTLLGLLAGLDLPTSGQVQVAGQLLSSMDEDARAAFRAQHLGFVFQSFHLIGNLSALENVALPLDLRGQKNSRAQAADFLRQVGLGQRLEHMPSELSGGEQQRVAIARAFASQPAYLLADEPTGNLDANTGAHIIELLFALNAEHGTTLVLVTHEERLAQRCQRQLRLTNGQLLA
ncbi:MAG: ABC transporter ATP-binding protein [Brachymonas sp.]